MSFSKKNKKTKSKKVNLNLRLIPSYPGQATQQIDIPCTPTLLATTVTTGLIASVITVSKALVEAFATRFGATWDEYRIVRAHFTYRMMSSINPGLIQVWFDEQSNVTPSLAGSQSRFVKSWNASAVDEDLSITWVPSDLGDLVYTAIGSTSTPVYLKTYTDNANYGAQNTVVNYVLVVPKLTFQFRGFQS